MENKRSPLKEILVFALGELVIAAMTVVGALVLDVAGIADFGLNVIWGAILGCGVIVANYSLLTLSVNHEVNKFIELRGDREMDEEEAKAFAQKNSTPIQNAIKTSFIIRTVSMTVTLVVAFLTSWFNPLATAIPMFAFRPLLTVTEMIYSRSNKAPDPSKFIKYDDDEKNNEEKESD